MTRCTAFWRSRRIWGCTRRQRRNWCRRATRCMRSSAARRMSRCRRRFLTSRSRWWNTRIRMCCPSRPSAISASWSCTWRGCLHRDSARCLRQRNPRRRRCATSWSTRALTRFCTKARLTRCRSRFRQAKSRTSTCISRARRRSRSFARIRIWSSRWWIFRADFSRLRALRLAWRRAAGRFRGMCSSSQSWWSAYSTRLCSQTFRRRGLTSTPTTAMSPHWTRW